MFNKFRDKYYKWKARNLYCRSYIRFNAIVKFKNGVIKILNYTDYVINDINAYKHICMRNKIIDINNYNHIYYIEDIDYFMALPVEYKELYCKERKNNYYTDITLDTIEKINIKNKKLIPYIKRENIIKKEECYYDVEAWLKNFNKEDMINI